MNRYIRKPMQRSTDFCFATLADVLDAADIASQRTRDRLRELTELLRACHALAQINMTPDGHEGLPKLTFEAAQYLFIDLLSQRDCRTTIDGLVPRL